MFDESPSDDALFYRLQPYIQRSETKAAAWKMVKEAVRRGQLTREPCAVVGCGNPQTDAHHPDYAEPLRVLWLCRAHHLAWHETHGQGLNGGDDECGRFPARRRLVGRRFGKLRVERPLDDRRIDGCVAWLCVCDCGRKVVRSTSALTGSDAAGHRAMCKECRGRSWIDTHRRYVGSWVAMYRRGDGLYGRNSEGRIGRDIRDAIIAELGFEPIEERDRWLALGVDGSGFGSAVEADRFDSPPLTKLLKRQVTKKQRARSRAGGLKSAAKRKAA